MEICDFYGLNPYQMVSGGSMLMAAADGNGLAHRLRQAGIPAALVGKATAGNDRIILNGEERRFLDLPQTDEIHGSSDESWPCKRQGGLWISLRGQEKRQTGRNIQDGETEHRTV